MFLNRSPRTASELRAVLTEVFKMAFVEDQVAVQRKKVYFANTEEVTYTPSPNVIAVIASILEKIMVDSLDHPVFPGQEGHRLVDKRELAALRRVETKVRELMPRLGQDGDSRPFVRLTSEDVEELVEALNDINACRGTGMDLAEEEHLAIAQMFRDRDRLDGV